MHAFVLVGPSKENQEKETARILKPYAIDPIDITRISPQHSIGIAAIRELKRAISLAPFRSKAKAMIIEDAQTLTVEAQNALLKTLEEPPNNTIILLHVSTHTEALLPTIVSRCQVIEISTPGNWQLASNELEARSLELEAILESGMGERLRLAQEATKDRETAIAWLYKMILATRQKLLDAIVQDKYFGHPTSQLLFVLKHLQRGHTLLTTTNVNPRLTLENLFLSLEMRHS